MVNVRTNQNLQAQLQSTTTKVVIKKEDNKVKTLEERLELVKAGEEDPNAILADLNIKNVQIKQVGKNKLNLTCDVNGKKVNITSTSIEDLKRKASFILGNEVDNQGEAEAPVSVILEILGLIAIAAIAYFVGYKEPEKPAEPAE